MQVAAMSAANNFAPELAESFANTLTALGPFGPNPHLAVAVSGGADSLALTLLAHHWAQARQGRITALTVDHGLRPESRAEAEYVARTLSAYGIAHSILTPAHTGHANNLQENARHWRYDALTDWCRAQDVLHCLIAHHAGDQRETVALHEARGDTADGPSGMAVMRPYRGVRLLRPLLGFEKAALIQALAAEGIAWVEDPSNQNAGFARVQARQVLESDGSKQQALSESARQQGEARSKRDASLANAAAAFVTVYPSGYAEFALSSWRLLAATLASQMLADLLTTISGAYQRPRHQDTARLCAALQAETFRRRTLHGCEITVRHGTVRMARETARVEAPVTLFGKGALTWDDRFHVHYDLPEGEEMLVRALGISAKTDLPAATPSFWHLDERPVAPHMNYQTANARVTIGFAPAKPLAAAPFWWLN